MKVYHAINQVQSELSKQGIAKDSENKGQGYKFRGIDAVYSALSPLLAKHGLLMLPRVLARTCEERTSRKGEALFNVTVDVEFDFVSSEDGSKHIVRTFGEAMDSADKATNKAMSAAYKYAAFMAFAIPTEGDNDADSHTHEVAPKARAKTVEAPIDDVQIEINDYKREILAKSTPQEKTAHLMAFKRSKPETSFTRLWGALPESVQDEINQAITDAKLKAKS